MTERKTLYHVAEIPQVDGGTRRVYARTARAAREAREIIAGEPGMIDHIPGLVVRDVERDEVRS